VAWLHRGLLCPHRLARMQALSVLHPDAAAPCEPQASAATSPFETSLEPGPRSVCSAAALNAARCAIGCSAGRRGLRLPAGDDDGRSGRQSASRRAVLSRHHSRSGPTGPIAHRAGGSGLHLDDPQMESRSVAGRLHIQSSTLTACQTAAPLTGLRCFQCISPLYIMAGISALHPPQHAAHYCRQKGR